MSQSFPKENRLKKRREFLSIMRQGKRRKGRYIYLDFRTYSRGSKLGITASSKYGDAPTRNRFKRIVREAYRQNRSQLPPNLELHVLPRFQAKLAKKQDIETEMLSLLSDLLCPLSSH